MILIALINWSFLASFTSLNSGWGMGLNENPATETARDRMGFDLGLMVSLRGRLQHTRRQRSQISLFGKG